MPNTTYNISVLEGMTSTLRVTAKDASNAALNISGYQARGYVKKSYSDTGILINLSPVIHPSYVSGYIDINISGNMTSGVAAGQYVYDVEIFNTGTFLKVLRGYFEIHPEVSI